MNLRRLSEIFFEEIYCVPLEQAVRSLFARLPHCAPYAASRIDCLATGYLVAGIELICPRKMHGHIDAATEVVVGRMVRIEHHGPVPPATFVRFQGWA